MNKIYKYVLGADTTLELPERSYVLTVAAQGVDICIWISVNTDAVVRRCKRRFKTVPTGDPTPDGLYLGTSFYGDRLVFHTFEILTS